MKTIGYLLSAAAMTALLASCTEKMEENNESHDTDAVRVEMTFKSKALSTKTQLDENGLDVIWSEDDAISLFDGVANEKFDIGNFDGSFAEFTGKAVKSSDYYAVYPYAEGNTMADGIISTVLPSSQTAMQGSFAQNVNLSYAKADEDGNLTFRNLCGLVTFEISSVPEGRTLTSVSFSGRNGEALSGNVSINTADGSASAAAAGGAGSVTLSGDEDGIPAGKYVFTSLPAVLEKGLVITFSYADGGTASIYAGGRLEIKAGVKANIGTVAAPVPADGTEANPYKIASAADLQNMKNIIAELDYSGTYPAGAPSVWFRLVSDIDMSGEEWTPLYVPESGLPWDGYPVINFDGNGHRISNLGVSGRHASFFGVMLGKCTDLTFENPVITYDSANPTPVGVVASVLPGYNRQGAGLATPELNNVHTVGGSVAGASGYRTDTEGSWDNPAYAAGGLCGVMRQGAVIANSTSSTKVDGTIVGGIAGVCQDGGKIDMSKSSGALYAHGDAVDVYAGGIAGMINGLENSVFEIINCSSSTPDNGIIDAKDMGHSAGGIVGKLGHHSLVHFCYSTAKVEARLNAGGIIGNAQGADNSNVTNCAAANTRIYTEPYACDIEWGLGLISGYISASGISMKDCHAVNGIEIQRKKPGTADVENITPQDNETGNVGSDVSFTLTRYWGSQDASNLDDAKSKAGIGAEI